MLRVDDQVEIEARNHHRQDRRSPAPTHDVQVDPFDFGIRNRKPVVGIGQPMQIQTVIPKVAAVNERVTKRRVSIRKNELRNVVGASFPVRLQTRPHNKSFLTLCSPLCI